jgi:hypothetical protein
VTLLALDVICPRCGTTPNIRIVPALVEMVQGQDPDKVLGTWGCQSKRCTEKVLITAGMIQRATAPALTHGHRAG